MKASQIQSAVNIATDFLAQQPKEKIELFFRRGTYLIDSKVIYRIKGLITCIQTLF